MSVRIFLVLVLTLKTIEQTGGDCTLSLAKDFGDPAPVYIKNDKFLAPNTQSGDVSVQRSETLLVGCPGRNRSVVLGEDITDVNVVEVQCISDAIFRAGKWVGEFKDIKCSASPWFTAERKNETCHDGHPLYRVGYQVAEKFFTLYEACFDELSLRTLYVRHELSPAVKLHQRGGKKPSFIDTGLFGKNHMSSVYSLKNQRNRVNEALGDRMDQHYITKKQFLTRGHLAPRADFVLRSQQRASFHYINAAPQWMRGNAGDWAALEDALRRRASISRTALTVYTGTYSVCTLADANGEQHELFLQVDINNNAVIPVPLYYYKVVYSPKNSTAVAFVSINSSYYNATNIDELTFCNDICEGNKNYSWLKWRSNDGTHSFCCDYEEFVKHIDYLPKLTVKGRFH
ncbi:uncharacterized protein [Battus philenor]|uniref:uncharacterized protein n=1 Tax=Battus philenor TaxID=42288 RepID=UPI0035D0ACC6